jgi:hypothetical protein
LCLVDVEDDEFANHRKERDQDNRADLNDIALLVKHDQQRVLKLHCDQDGQDHPKDGLEDLSVPRVQQMAPYKSEGMKDELPGRRPNDGCNDGGQQRND